MSIEVGSISQGKVTGITNFGAFVRLLDGNSGLVHISEISTEFIKKVSDALKVGDEVNVKVLSIADNGKLALSIKQTMEYEKQASFFEHNHRKKINKDENFDNLMNSFLKSSEKKISSLRKNIEGKRGGRGGRRS
ncbi:MAG: S1 RNA-binding domain-containing protein [Lactobacillales bacterium]|jgi:S1 RNA binding domain protein|nr:S1 RNA-binding domain-containing protein [Lactobacillales bacterium]